jgi:DNA invertase Pin-like site-specific DNA recombinase
MIADRTKAGLAAAKARGIKLGNAKLAVEAPVQAGNILPVRGVAAKQEMPSQTPQISDARHRINGHLWYRVIPR